MAPPRTLLKIRHLLPAGNEPSDPWPFVTLLAVFVVLGVFGVVASTLVPAVQTIFGVGLVLAIAVQWLPLVGGGLFAMPMAKALGRLGPVGLTRAGLAISALACLVLAGLVQMADRGPGGFAWVLFGIFLLAAGATALQVAINPLVLQLGPAHSAHVRLTLAQGCNALGVLGGVHLSARLALARAGASPEAASQMAAGVAQTYLVCALSVVLALIAASLTLRQRSMPPSTATATTAERPSLRAALRCPWARAGAMVLALYVGAEGAAGALLASFLHQPDVWDCSLPVAGLYLANGFWGGAALSRMGGAWLLRKMPAPVVLGAAAGAGVVASSVAIFGQGHLAGWAAVSLGLWNGVMFPLIFALTLDRTGAPRAAVSGVLVLAMSGGAIASALAGYIGEHAGLAAAFAVPLGAYVAIALFALAVGGGKAAVTPAGVADGE